MPVGVARSVYAGAMPLKMDCIAKIEWAERHREILDRLERDYLAAKPYRVDHEMLDEGRLHVYRLRLSSPVPIDAPLVMGDLLHNVRSSLDSLVFALSERGKGSPLVGDELRVPQFPITASDGQWASESVRRLKFVPAEACALIYEMQPYRDTYDVEGVHPLQKLADLSNVDKHRRLHVLSQAPRIGMLRSTDVPVPLPEWTWRPGPIADGDEVCRLRFDRPIALQPDAFLPTFALCLAESDGTEGWDLSEIALRLIAWVRHRVLKQFEPFLN
jgi:hypothetical protein